MQHRRWLKAIGNADTHYRLERTVARFLWITLDNVISSKKPLGRADMNIDKRAVRRWLLVEASFKFMACMSEIRSLLFIRMCQSEAQV